MYQNNYDCLLKRLVKIANYLLPTDIISQSFSL